MRLQNLLATACIFVVCGGTMPDGTIEYVGSSAFGSFLQRMHRGWNWLRGYPYRSVAPILSKSSTRSTSATMDETNSDVKFVPPSTADVSARTLTTRVTPPWASRHVTEPPAHPKSQSDIDEILNKMTSASTGGISPQLRLWGELREVIPSIFPDRHRRDKPHLLESAIYRSDLTGVYPIMGHGDIWVIKYQGFCPDMIFDRFHPILVEAWFLSELHSSSIPNLTHKFLYFSGPISQPDYDGKISKGADCDDGTRPIVRYMITEKVSTSLFQYRRDMGPFSVDSAVNFGIAMIRLIQALHETKSFIHGDAHLGNFAFPRTEENELILIDFGRSRLINLETDFKDGRVKLVDNRDGPETESIWCSVTLSQWESRYFKPSFRDDVYQVFLGVAMLMHTNLYRKTIDDICNEKRNEIYWKNIYMKFKEEQNLFHGSLHHPIGESFVFSLGELITDDDVALYSIIALFGKALTELRNTDIDQLPNYNGIICDFSRIVKLAGGVSIDETACIEF